MEYSNPRRWQEPPRPNANAVFVNAVKNCRSQSHTPCQTIEYPVEIERSSMPREFQTSSDYVSRITVVYSSLEITNISEERDPNFYYLLSYIGYNAALWFAIGHIICNRHGRPRSAKVMPIINGGFVTPAATVTSDPPLIIQRNQQLPPIHEDADNNSLKPPSINTEPDISRPIVILETEQISPK
uniref:Uncharacterized protein n=1 Tax=Panagrolaimus sp. ES5 TaxID=591445 RepID=A0AC34G009_9BILA